MHPFAQDGRVLVLPGEEGVGPSLRYVLLNAAAHFGQVEYCLASASACRCVLLGFKQWIPGWQWN